MSVLPDHAFFKAGPTDSRSPCPALNALANHNYIPRSGKNITFFTLFRALREVYNLSYLLALLLTLGGFLFCGHGFLHAWIDLSDLSAHNRIEHNASLVHDDTPPGSKIAPIQVDAGLLRSFLADAATGHGLILADFAHARALKEAKLSKPLCVFHAQIAYGEAALTWLLMKDDNEEVAKTTLEEWWGEEKIPDRWHSKKTIGLLETRETAEELQKIMKGVGRKQD